jgi:hypothetical protein
MTEVFLCNYCGNAHQSRFLAEVCCDSGAQRAWLCACGDVAYARVMAGAHAAQCDFARAGKEAA